VTHHKSGDPVKRAQKRARQRAAGYQGVKKKGQPGVVRHNKGRMSRDGRTGAASQ
jgi:hypothetical protein